MTSRIELIDDDNTLAALCQQWLQKDFLCLDTEFVRTDTFYPKLGLIQVCDDENTYLLDPLALRDREPLREVLRAQHLVKVLHSASEDLQAFDSDLGCLPTPLFDTQKAAAFVGHGNSLSYQALVAELLDVTVDKGEPRTDWLRRPLSQQQLDYAVQDVAWLPALYQHLRAALESRGRLQWCLQECQDMLLTTELNEDPEQWEQLYLGMGAAWRLKPEQLVVLKALCIWRERLARELDKPRPWVARDADLILLVQKQPETRRQLLSLEALSPALRRKAEAGTIDSLLAAMRSVDVTTELQQSRSAIESAMAIHRPLDPAQRRRLKRCQAALRQVAEEHNLAVELLARKKQLLALVVQYDQMQDQDFSWPAELQGWRQEIIEGPLRVALAGTQSPVTEEAG